MSRLLAVVGLIVSAGVALAAETGTAWPRWRGPDGSGAAPQSNPPVRWSEQENVRWKVDVPGVGNSSPIVHDQRVYVATAMKTEPVESAEANRTDADTAQPSAAESQRGERQAEARNRRPRRIGGRGGRRSGGRGRFRAPAPTHRYAYMLLAYERATGQEVWRTTLAEALPHEPGHPTNTFASTSPVTDGERLYVSFGSRGVYAVDFDGKRLWQRDLGMMSTRAQFGEGSSPAVHGGILVVPFDHEGDSFIVALDAKSGSEIWRQPRDERTTWATPLITEFEGRAQVITNGSNRVRSYDLRTGKVIWQCGGQASNPIPTPIRYRDNVIVMTGYRGYAIDSIPLSAKGDITDQEVVSWRQDDAAPYVSSPLLYDDQLYFTKSNRGVLLSRDAATGELIIDQTRIPEVSNLYASPVGAGGHVYITGRDGTTVVIRHTSEFEVVAINHLDAQIDASAAIVDDELYLRGKQALYCIARE